VDTKGKKHLPTKILPAPIFKFANDADDSFLVDTKTESFWLNFRNGIGDNLRIGVNPLGTFNLAYKSKKNEANLGRNSYLFK
jgi:hypothetical protein